MPRRPVTLRPKVAAFAELMELKLREHDGWMDDGYAELLARLLEETSELVSSFKPGAGSKAGAAYNATFLLLTKHHVDIAAKQIVDTVMTPTKASVGETIDIANFCLFLVDILGGFKLPKTE